MDLRDPLFSDIARRFNYDTEKIGVYQRLMKALEAREIDKVIYCYLKLGWADEAEHIAETVMPYKTVKILIEYGREDIAYRVAQKTGVGISFVIGCFQ